RAPPQSRSFSATDGSPPRARHRTEDAEADAARVGVGRAGLAAALPSDALLIRVAGVFTPAAVLDVRRRIHALPAAWDETARAPAGGAACRRRALATTL